MLLWLHKLKKELGFNLFQANEGLRDESLEMNKITKSSIDPRVYLKLFILASIFIGIYYSVFFNLVLDWWNNSSYSYGFMIPLISIYFLWTSRTRLARISVSPSAWGFPLFLLGLLSYIVGFAGNEPFIIRVSMILSLMGIVHLLCGWAVFREVLFPLGYLFLMIPMPYILFKSIAYYLRIFNAQFSSEIIQWFGIPTFRESYFIHLPNIILEVADVCSGVLSILSLLATGILYVFLFQKRGLNRVILCLSIIPISILSNNFRIILTAVLVHYFGKAVLDTPFHMFHGTVNFFLSVMILILVGKFLNWTSGTFPGNKEAV